GGGRIVNFSDWIAKSGRPRYVGYVPYYVAKTGVIALTEALALELASDNILVNAIAPGPILAPPGTTGDELKAVEDATPLARRRRSRRRTANRATGTAPRRTRASRPIADRPCACSGRRTRRDRVRSARARCVCWRLARASSG